MTTQDDMKRAAREFYATVARVAENPNLPNEKRSGLFWRFTALILAHDAASRRGEGVWDLHANLMLRETLGQDIGPEDLREVAQGVLAAMNLRGNAKAQALKNAKVVSMVRDVNARRIIEP